MKSQTHTSGLDVLIVYGYDKVAVATDFLDSMSVVCIARIPAPFVFGLFRFNIDPRTAGRSLEFLTLIQWRHK